MNIIRGIIQRNISIITLNQDLLEVPSLELSQALLAPPHPELDHLQHQLVLDNDMWSGHPGRGNVLLVRFQHLRLVSALQGL